MKLRKGDTVKIIKGKDRGKTGKVSTVFPAKDKLSVEGLNLFKKHVRPKKQGEKGETVMVSRPMSASNVMIICSSCGKAVRIGFTIEEKSKFRQCKKCKARI